MPSRSAFWTQYDWMLLAYLTIRQSRRSFASAPVRQSAGTAGGAGGAPVLRGRIVAELASGVAAEDGQDDGDEDAETPPPPASVRPRPGPPRPRKVADLRRIEADVPSERS